MENINGPIDWLLMTTLGTKTAEDLGSNVEILNLDPDEVQGLATLVMSQTNFIERFTGQSKIYFKIKFKLIKLE